MKSALAKDIWKATLSRKPGPVSLKEIQIRNVRGIGDATLEFPAPFIAICGENGAGKTTVLKTIFAALAPTYAASRRIALRCQDETQPNGAKVIIELRGSHQNKAVVQVLTEPKEIAAILEPEGNAPKVEYVDAALYAQRIKYVLQHDQDFPSALEGTPAVADSPDILTTRREITGRTYDEVVTYEIEDYGTEPTFPYFRVKTGGITYGSEDMGQGELCANILLWAFMRMDSDGFLLVEEPESHLPPRAQSAIMNYLAHLSNEKRLTVILSTHSQHTLTNIQLTHIMMLARNGDRFIYLPRPPISTLQETLRIVSIRPTVIVVEDHSAGAFLRTLIRLLDEPLLDHIDIGWSNGWGGIDEILKRVPAELKKASLIGVYDGDQREAPRPDCKWPYDFLPGDGDPAQYMAEAVKRQTVSFSEYFVPHQKDVELALAHQAQTDAKDYFLNLSRALGEMVDTKRLYAVATELWLSEGNNKLSAEKLVRSLKSKIIS